MDYKDYNDYELLAFVAEKDENASEILFKKYDFLITKFAKKMLKYNKNNGLELNDLIQEGMIGFSNAIDTFNEHKEASFYTYAKKCVERKIISAIVASNRLKMSYLNNSIPIDYDEAGENRSLDYLLTNDSLNPENIIINKEKMDNLNLLAKEKLTDFEVQVFELKLSGFDYKEIAEILDKDIKAVDNALQRIKYKLKKEISV